MDFVRNQNLVEERKRKGNKLVRDPNRLDEFYDELKNLHKTYFPDWRFGQFIENVFERMLTKDKVNPFFVEEDTMLQYFENFCKKVGGENRGRKV